MFRSGLADPALLNAILLTLTFAVNSNSVDAKVLAYKGETLRWVNKRLQDPENAITSATIGAILLLVGVEVGRYSSLAPHSALTADFEKARVGAPESVRAHMHGLSLMLRLCDSQGLSLHDGIKRAVFW